MEGDWSRARCDRIIALCEEARGRIAKMEKQGDRLLDALEELEGLLAKTGQDTLLGTPPRWLSEWKEKSRRG